MSHELRPMASGIYQAGRKGGKMRVGWIPLRGREEGFVNVVLHTDTETSDGSLCARVRTEAALHRESGSVACVRGPDGKQLIDYHDHSTSALTKQNERNAFLYLYDKDETTEIYRLFFFSKKKKSDIILVI
jgi:hypothetical protein